MIPLAFGVFDKKNARWGWSLDEKCEHVRSKAALLVGTQERLYQEMLDDLKARAPKVAQEAEAAA